MTPSLEHDAILTALQQGDLTLQGQFLNGSNYTFLVQVVYEGQSMRAVYKPAKGEQPLWDFPASTLGRREVAAYLISQALGWELVPPTVFRRSKAPHGRGSLQFYVEHDPDLHYFRMDDAQKQQLRPVVLFDLLINNADRKGGHLLMGVDGKLWVIDHGVCFHVEDKLRTVIWDFAGEAIPAALLADVARLVEQLGVEGGLVEQFRGLLRRSEIAALFRRARALQESGIYPSPTNSRRAFPWPPV